MKHIFLVLTSAFNTLGHCWHAEIGVRIHNVTIWFCAKETQIYQQTLQLIYHYNVTKDIWSINQLSDVNRYVLGFERSDTHWFHYIFKVCFIAKIVDGYIYTIRILFHSKSSWCFYIYYTYTTAYTDHHQRYHWWSIGGTINCCPGQHTKPTFRQWNLEKY